MTKTTPTTQQKNLTADPESCDDLLATDDPFSPENLSRLRMSQDFSAATAVKPAITNIAVRKPNRHEFVRVRTGAGWRFETGCFIDKESREVYLFSPELWLAMPGEVTPTCLVLAITRNSPIPFLWPLTMPDGERPNRWHESAIEAARMAEQNWLRIVADMAAGQYVPYVAAAHLPEPEWPDDLELSEYIRLAFKDRFVNDTDHPLLRRLRGEV